jgi:hypothetical protein
VHVKRVQLPIDVSGRIGRSSCRYLEMVMAPSGEGEERALYHQVLEDALALFNLLFLGPPSPVDIIFGAIEALVADGERLSALPGQSQQRDELQRAVGVATEEAATLAPDPLERSLERQRDALRGAIGDIRRLVPELISDLPTPLGARLWWPVRSSLRWLVDTFRTAFGSFPRPPGRTGAPPAPPPLRPPPPGQRVWRVTCTSCGWTPRTDATLYVGGSSFPVHTGSDGCVREVVTLRMAHQPSRVQIVGAELQGVTPQMDCSVVDVTP